MHSTSFLAKLFRCTALVSLLLVPAATVHAAQYGQGAKEPAANVNPYKVNSWQWTLFNSTASLFGLPGLVSPVDGLRDEGLGFHADGTTRRADGSTGGSGTDSSARFGGQRAGSYMRSGLDGMYGMNQRWLYDDLMGFSRGADGRMLRPGDEYSGRRDVGRYGSTLFGDGTGSITQSFIQKGISAGMGFANTAAESAILGLMGSDSPYGSGKARLNFNWYIDDKGKSRFGGEGDVLWPLFDTPYTTIYTQVGARSMFGGSSGGNDYGPDRWIGNFGLGQRWFPGASVDADGKVDSGNWMVGYNAFFDYDFTRGHQRGGLGVEAQYDWFKVGSNYYAPLSNWKDSKDFDGNYVQERAAQGWDLRAKGYLPFYREIALTGSYTQWYGDHVGMFGPSKLEKDPKVWSYGVEYTPVPAMTAFVNQRQTERGRADTEFGLRFTYHFGMDAESQFKPSRVAEMRTVHGARHDFVDRENKIILEYKAKNKFHIEFAGRNGNVFTFRVRNGFDKYVAGQTVRVSATDVSTLAALESRSYFAQALDSLGNLLVSPAHAANVSQSYTTNNRGEISVTITNLLTTSTVTVQAGESSRTYTAAELGGGSSSGIQVAVSGDTATLTLVAYDSAGNPVSTGHVTWTITASSSTNAAVTAAFKPTLYGLQLDSLAQIMPSAYATVNTGDYSDKVSTSKAVSQSVTLSDILGERSVTVTATMLIDGTQQTFSATVAFGEGSLAAFRLPTGTVQSKKWADNLPISNGGNMAVSNFPAAYHCGTSLSASELRGLLDTYDDRTRLPSNVQLFNVSSRGNNAWKAAGWPYVNLWTGEVYGGGLSAFFVTPNGYDGGDSVAYVNPVVCLR